MGDLGYLNGIVKILETPTLSANKNGSSYINVRAYLPQVSKKLCKPVVRLIFCGYLANDVLKYYTKNDYVLIEGSILINKVDSQVFRANNNLQKSTVIDVQKIFPLFLDG
jgi:hypothetical protein